MSVFTNPATGAGDAASRYIRATLDMLGGREPLAVLARTADAIEEMVLGVDSEILNRPESPGKWSVTGVIAHLADSDLVWSNRLRFVLAEDRPPLVGYDQDLWADRLRYDGREAREEHSLFRVVRAANLGLLGRLEPTDLARVGIHAERGEESVGHMIQLYAGHDLVHLAQARRILGSITPSR